MTFFLFFAILSSTIHFSNNNGNTWNQITEDFVSTSYSWNVSLLNTGTVILLKINTECSTGFISSSAINTFSVTGNSSSTTTAERTSFDSSPVLFILILTVVHILRRKQLQI